MFNTVGEKKNGEYWRLNHKGSNYQKETMHNKSLCECHEFWFGFYMHHFFGRSFFLQRSPLHISSRFPRFVIFYIYICISYYCANYRRVQVWHHNIRSLLSSSALALELSLIFTTLLGIFFF